MIVRERERERGHRVLYIHRQTTLSKYRILPRSVMIAEIAIYDVPVNVSANAYTRFLHK